MVQEIQQATQTTPATMLPFMPQRHEITKASEKIEMQRATAEVFASHQRAIQYPRDEQRCIEKILAMCANIHFASDAISKVENRGEVLKVQTLKSIALIWGNLDSGSVEHGIYGEEVQCESYATDLESNYRRVTRYTVSLKYKTKDGEGNTIYKTKLDPEDISKHVKARQSKEERNCIRSVFPDWLYDRVKLECKRTMTAEVSDVRQAWAGWVQLYEKLGVKPLSMMRYVDKSDLKDVTAADIVELRILYNDARNDVKVLDWAFPDRDKSKTAKLEAAQAEKAATEPPKQNKQQQKKDEKKETAAAPPAPSTQPQSAAPSAAEQSTVGSAPKETAAETKKPEAAESQQQSQNDGPELGSSNTDSSVSDAETEATEQEATAETESDVSPTGTNDGSKDQTASSSNASSGAASTSVATAPPERKRVSLFS